MDALRRLELADALSADVETLNKDMHLLLEFSIKKPLCDSGLRLKIDSDKTRANLDQFDCLIHKCRENATVLLKYYSDSCPALGGTIDEKDVLALLNGLSTTVEALAWSIDTAEETARNSGGYVLDDGMDWENIYMFDDYLRSACRGDASFYLRALADYFQYQ